MQLNQHISFTQGPDQYGIVGADAETEIRAQENLDIRYISQY